MILKYVVDTHTHAIASGHAYSTIEENFRKGKEKGLEVIAITDHAPSMPGSCHEFYFGNLNNLPRYIDGILALRGAELNIINFNGDIDLSEKRLKKLDLLIASLHEVCIFPGSIYKNTNALLKAMDNKYIDILGHLGNPLYPIDKEVIIKKAKEKNIIIEINNGSFHSRKGSEENCKELIKLCIKYGVKLTISSDAHFSSQVGEFEKSIKMIDSLNVPQDLILNINRNRIIDHLIKKGKLNDLI